MTPGGRYSGSPVQPPFPSIMTSIPALSAAALMAVLAAGCATADTKAVNAETSTPEYRTGSNIPVRGSKPTTEEERARAAEQAREMQRNTSAVKP